MSGFSTPAILLRRIDHGDHDLIITFFSREKGRIPVIAKNAKKSRKRFSGLLEPFTVLELVCRSPRRGGMPVLQEAAMQTPFAEIRDDVVKTLYASYWAELLCGWLEEYRPQAKIYRLLYYALRGLDRNLAAPAEMSIIFQVRFLTLAGLAPRMDGCVACQTPLDRMGSLAFFFDLEKGGIVCNGCAADSGRSRIRISPGTVKQLAWIQENEIRTVQRLRLTGSAVKEGLLAMEAFVPYHLGRVPRSLRVLQQMRRQ
ncbi:DNA repair protein RecO (recombination protein O) [Desulfosalsimonas propionicica]|jgi:DNA repair protein RecO (recombination protein O)|uniref:DNA repair protein RecO n=1 Tax=Desulfosalsimonas propionicica TaxID=332175 RepID=A0A7W0C9K2_9BACT|nr:DNA repair protein RecO [Desulfosalsimonas propionicica]MBA2881684.1 DNA repair protein RecO (recombination protein O) [Desulfosalsimonas propionicica]